MVNHSKILPFILIALAWIVTDLICQNGFLVPSKFFLLSKDQNGSYSQKLQEKIANLWAIIIKSILLKYYPSDEVITV